MKKIGLFAAGVLFGTAGMKLLGSKDAKKSLRPDHCRRTAGKGQRDDRCDRCA